MLWHILVQMNLLYLLLDHLMLSYVKYFLCTPKMSNRVSGPKAYRPQHTQQTPSPQRSSFLYSKNTMLTKRVINWICSTDFAQCSNLFVLHFSKANNFSATSIVFDLYQLVDWISNNSYQSFNQFYILNFNENSI